MRAAFCTKLVVEATLRNSNQDDDQLGLDLSVIQQLDQCMSLEDEFKLLVKQVIPDPDLDLFDPNCDKPEYSMII